MKNKLIENIIFTEEQNKIKDLISRKNFSTNLKTDNFEEKNNQDKNEKNKILEYLLSNKEQQPGENNKSLQELMDNLSK